MSASRPAWTSIIGVVHAGISIGAYLGGRLADRFPDTRTLAWLFLISGMAVLLILSVTNLIAGYKFQTALMVRILIVTTMTFFIPSCILGMISPVAVELALRKADRVGRVVGKIYAFSTFGSIIGTFAAGFFLISWMGTRQLMLLMGGILMLAGIIYGSFFRTRKAVMGMIAIPAILVGGYYDLAFKPAIDPDIIHYKESDYYTIKVRSLLACDGKTRIKSIVLDHLTHSYINTEDPLHLEYEYDVVLIDAFNDLSIPYHLTTREFAEQIKTIMNPGGILLTNIIDNFQQG